MKPLIYGFMGFVVLASLLVGQTPLPQVTLETIAKEHMAAEGAMNAARKAAKTRAEKDDAYREGTAKIAKILEQVRGLIRGKEASEDGKKGLLYLLMNGRGSELRNWAAIEAATHHANDGLALKHAMLHMRYDFSDRATQILKTLSENASPAIAVPASYTEVARKGEYLNSLARTKTLAAEEKEKRLIQMGIDPKAIWTIDTEAFEIQRRKTLRRIATNEVAAGIKFFRRSYKEIAASELFEAERLQIGMKVPEIIGEDTDGVKFRLSDYAGKVIMIDFWGHW